jgi:hypothetical protein
MFEKDATDPDLEWCNERLLSPISNPRHYVAWHECEEPWVHCSSLMGNHEVYNKPLEQAWFVTELTKYLHWWTRSSRSRIEEITLWISLFSIILCFSLCSIYSSNKDCLEFIGQQWPHITLISWRYSEMDFDPFVERERRSLRCMIQAQALQTSWWGYPKLVWKSLHYLAW